jgi:hypothetical protein
MRLHSEQTASKAEPTEAFLLYPYFSYWYSGMVTVKRSLKVLSSYVFCSPEGKFLHNFDRQWRPALRAARVPDFRFHDCRHTFASRLAMAGVDLYTVQRAGGWKTQVMVQRYAHLSPDHMRAAVERLATLSECGTGTKTGTYAEDGDAREGAKLSNANGGGGRTRTSDTGLMRPLLCHLSYAAASVGRAENLQAYEGRVKRASVI